MKDIEGIDRAIAVLKPHWNEIDAEFERHNNRFKDLFAADHDTIGRVLRAHLVVESFLESYLRETFGFDSDALRLSFAQKAGMLPTGRSSAAFVRPGVIQLNKVRNRFAHDMKHAVEQHHVSAIYEALEISRKTAKFPDPVEAIEAFAAVACAFLSVPPPRLNELFRKAFAEVRVYPIEE